MKIKNEKRIIPYYLSKILFTLGFCLLLFPSFAQKNTENISGKVLDKQGQPIIGVNIMIPGTSTGTITNVDGLWTLSVPASATKLKFSYIGFQDQIVTIGNSRVYDITMIESSREIDEVVVIGYGTVKKSDVTGSVSSVKSDAIARQPVTNAAQSLQGLVPGVSVTSNSGSPGGSVAVRIRGIGTVGNSDPLYVVDGMPVNDIAYLSSNEIETIEVLKDASATAIYGSRGANGVILVTTKHGQKGRNVISVSSYWGTTDKYRPGFTQWSTMV